MPGLRSAIAVVTSGGRERLSARTLLRARPRLWRTILLWPSSPWLPLAAPLWAVAAEAGPLRVTWWAGPVAAEFLLVAASPIIPSGRSCSGPRATLPLDIFASSGACVAAWIGVAAVVTGAVAALAVVAGTVATARRGIAAVVAPGITPTVAVAVAATTTTPAKPGPIVEDCVGVVQQDHLPLFGLAFFLGNAAAAFFG